MKRDALPRKKSECLRNQPTLSKNPNRKDRKKTNKLKRKLTDPHHSLTTQNQFIEQNSSKLQKMEPETAQNSQQIEPQTEIQPYTSQIVSYLSKVDEEFLMENSKNQNGFPNNQVNVSMRKTLLKWLYKFATILKLKSQTLHICIQLIDCVLIHEPNKIIKTNFQLLGVTCLFMASKLVQVISPQAKRFTDACDGLYSLSQLFEMEQFVLLTMKFVLQVPTIYQFLNIFIEQENISKEQQVLLKSIGQLCTFDFNLFNKYTKLTLSAIVIYLWAKVSNVQQIRSKKLMQKYNISAEIFQKCLKELMIIYRKSYLFNQLSESMTSN